MKRYLKLYVWFWTQRLKVLLEYPASTLVGEAGLGLLSLTGVLNLWVVMRQVPDLRGWSYDEVLLIYGLFVLSLGLSFIFGQNLWSLGHYVRTGGLDHLWVRPINPLFQLVVEHFRYSGMGDTLVGAVVTVNAMLALGILWSPLKVLALLLGVLSGTAIFMALFLIPSVTGFWIMDSASQLASVFYLVNNFAKYPLNIYPRVVVMMLTWLLPYGFASYYPASYLLGKEAGRLVWAGPLVAAILLFLGYRFWLFGLRHYTSTGS